MKKFILAIDQGTTATTVLIIDHDMTIAAKANNEITQYYPKPGWVEHDANEIWDVTQKTIAQALSSAHIDKNSIAAIGITNQRETTVLWDRATGRPFHHALVWQDRRTDPLCERLRKRGLSSLIKRKTGLVLDPYFSATKINWLLKNISQTKRASQVKKLCFGTIDSFLTWKLTGGKIHVTDVSNASRTLLMNVNTLEWDDELLKLFSVPHSILPRICSNSEIYGHTKDLACLPDGIPIAGMAGDQQAALFGQACFDVGEAKCTYGTGSFLLMNIGDKPVFSKHGLLTTVAWKIKDRTTYALEGSSFISGAAVQWLRDGLKLIAASSEIESLAKTVTDNGGVCFVPALTGLGAPHWHAHARGLICGLTRGTTAGHIARATLEGIAFSQWDILQAMQKDCGKKLKSLKVDGGVSVNNFLMQFQADVLNCHIARPEIVETTALGAAFLAGLAVGYWKSLDEIKQSVRTNHAFYPRMKKSDRDQALVLWQKAVRKAL